MESFHASKVKAVVDLKVSAREFLDVSLPTVLSQGKDLWTHCVSSGRVMKRAGDAVLTDYIVSRSMDKLNDTVTDNIGLLYDLDDDKSGFDVRPFFLDDEMRSNMIVFAVNTAIAANPAASFTEERLEGIRRLFDTFPSYRITTRGVRQGNMDFSSARATQLTIHRLKTFLSFIGSFSVVIVTKVERSEDSNLFLRPFLPATDFSMLPQGWEYVKMVSLTKSFYHTADVDSSAVAVSHHCKILKAHRLLAQVEPLRRQGRPTNTSNYMSRENEAPTTASGYRALMKNMIVNSRSWSEFNFEKVLLTGLDGVVGDVMGAVIKGRLAINVSTRINGVVRTPYVFTVRALHGVLNNDLGDQMFIDIELGESEFVSQWAKTAMNHLNGRIAGMQQSSYTDVTGNSDSEDDA